MSCMQRFRNFCSILWLRMSWPKCSWDHITGFLQNQKFISSEGSVNECWLHFLRISSGPMGGTTGTQNWNGWLAPTAALQICNSIQWKMEQAAELLLKGSGGSEAAGKEWRQGTSNRRASIPGWILCSWGRRKSTPLIELPAGLEE